MKYGWLFLALLLGVLLFAAPAVSENEQSLDVNGFPDLALEAIEKPGPWNVNLMPLFEAAAERYKVPLPLLLTLAYYGSAFENRGGAPTIEGGYGLMALRSKVKNRRGADSFEEGMALAGATEIDLKLKPAPSINAAAAVLARYAKKHNIDISKGLEAWLQPVIEYAGLDEEDSRFFAMEVFDKLQRGLDHTNTEGERFYFPPQDIGPIDLASLAPPPMAFAPEMQTASDPVVPSTDYGPAIWDPAPTCNYSTSWTNKDTVIIHTIEGTAAGARSWMKNCASNVTSQYVISEAGTVWQMVREGQVAWHAGCYNSRSIGLEHEGYAASSSHPKSLYDASALLVRDICNDWGIPKEKRTVGPGILGHVDVTRCCCGTHWDPGNGWDWNYYIGQVRGTPPPPTWAASYRAQSYPSTMTAGSTAIVWVEYTNQGTGHWKHGETYLGTSSPQDRSSPFCNIPNWTGCNRPTEVDQTDVSQGQVGRFTFILKAPAAPGVYTEKFRLVREGVTWFGDEITWTITVSASTGNITGTVRNATNGQAVAGASVSIVDGPSTTTNSSGIYNFNGLSPATYTINVSAAGFNPASSSVEVTAGQTSVKDFILVWSDTDAPSAPSDLSATAVSPSQINLAWTGSTDSGGSGLAGYIIYRDGAEVGRTGNTSYQDNGLMANTSYSYFVKAYDNANNISGASNTASAATLPPTVPIFEDGFSNLDYWEPIVQSPMPGAYPAVLVTDKDHGYFTGSGCLKTQTSSDPNQGCLIGHRFDTAFATAKFETYFLDGSGMQYTTEFENGTDGWVSYPSAYATLSTVGGGVSGNCLQASDGGWTSGVYKELTSGFSVGGAYSFSMRAKWPAPPAGKSYTTPPRCFVRFFNAAGAEIRTDYSVNITTDNAWRQYTITGQTVPAGTTRVWIGHWGVLGATSTFNYYADNVAFSMAQPATLSDNSRQGLQVRCVDPQGGVKAIYYLGTYPAAPGSYTTYSAGYYKVCGSGCTGWYWPGAAAVTRTPGWHKFTIEFLPYTGTGGDVKYYIDNVLVATTERTLDTQLYGLNMVAYGYHYRVNVESWFDDCAMYAASPVAPTMGSALALSETSIRWTMTDNSNNEIGFKVQDASQATKATAAVMNGAGGLALVDETGLEPNTPYTRIAKAFNGTLDSAPSDSATRWTLSTPPNPSNVLCDKASGQWSGSAEFTFTAVGGFGQGTVAKYLYAWDTSPTHTWTDTESMWNSGSLILTVPESGQYYLHLKGFNGEDIANGTLDLGPYSFDGTEPENPTEALETHGAQNGVWQSEVSDPAFTWSGASDAGSGIAGYKVYFGPSEQGTSDTVVVNPEYDPAAVETGVYYLRVCAKDAAGNEAGEWATLFTFMYDGSAPGTPTVSDDGPYSGSRTRLHATWSAVDEDSGVAEYSYAVGTTAGASDVLDWTSAGSDAEAVIAVPDPGLSLGQDYYISVKAKNTAGLWSEAGSSDGLQLTPDALTVAGAKGQPNDAPVGLISKVVTASFAGSFYIEEADRSSGILVLSPGPDVGALVTIGGIMGVNGVGERAILSPATIIEAAADPLRVPGPLFMQGRALGGLAFNAETPGIANGIGLNTVGLLVRVCGWVKSFNEQELYLDDGSGQVKVVRSPMGFGTIGATDFVSVTGICSLELDGDILKPIIRLRTVEDVRKLN